MPLTSAIGIERGNSELQDRAIVLELDNKIAFCLADGAGGISGGAEAADLAIQIFRKAVVKSNAKGRFLNDDYFSKLAGVIDRVVCRDPNSGECTLVIGCIYMSMNAPFILGASVGDSEAYLVLEDQVHELTENQIRRPFIGTEEAIVIPFGVRGNPNATGTLIIASDGLFKYSSFEKILSSARTYTSLDKLPVSLIDLARLQNGQLQDDAAVIVIRSECAE